MSTLQKPATFASEGVSKNSFVSHIRLWTVLGKSKFKNITMMHLNLSEEDKELELIAEYAPVVILKKVSIRCIGQLPCLQKWNHIIGRREREKKVSYSQNLLVISQRKYI